ncbi:hypothetical protein pb186bvf_017755 [Paramecium bursaria]
MYYQLIEILLLLAYVIYLVREYAQKQVTCMIKTVTFIAWVISFAIVFIIPHDIYFTLQGIGGTEYIWRIILWTNFFLTWILLPLLQDYEEGGEFTSREKLTSSLKINMERYLKYGALTLIFLVTLTVKWNFDTMINIIIALANGFGVLLVVVLLGDGLIAIPRDYWRKSMYQTQLRNNYQQLVSIDEKIRQLSKRLQVVTGELISLKDYYTNHPFWFEYVESVLSQIPYDFIEMGDKSDLIEINMEKMIEINKNTKNLVAEYRRAQVKWEQVCKESFWMEDLEFNQFNFKIKSTLYETQDGWTGLITYKWNTKYRALYLKAMSIIFFTFSLIIILGEISIFTKYDWNLIAHIMSKEYSFWTIQILTLIPLMYMSFCTFYGLFRINFAGMYGFYKHQQTDAPSLMFGSMNLSRVSFPLAFNFLQLAQVTKTPFTQVLGDMDVVPVLGMSFSYCLPILLILASLFNFFEIYEKILIAFGMPDNEGTKDQFEVREEQGKKLLSRARTLKEREKLNANQKGLFKDVETRKIKNNCYMAFQNLEEILQI